MSRLIIIPLICCFLLSCKKKEMEEVKISGNKSLPDSTVSNIIPENYVNKVYISLLGRKPSDAELSAGVTKLKPNNFSSANRSDFLDDVLARPDYNPRVYSIARIDLLNDVDTNEFTNYITIFNILLADTVYSFAWPQLLIEIGRLQNMQTISSGLNAGTIDIKGLHRRCVENYFYDQINMGTENFVVSLWQHFLFRYPTDNELAEAKKMVDGFNGLLFLLDGYSKKDFLDIFFASDEYYEGQVRDLFTRYLFRKPTSVEMTDLAKQYKNSGSYKGIQKSILITNEYAGLK